MVRLPPGVGPGRRKVLAGRYRGRTFMLLLLDLGDLIGVLIATRVSRVSGVARAWPEYPGTPPAVGRATASGF